MARDVGRLGDCGGCASIVTMRVQSRFEILTLVLACLFGGGGACGGREDQSTKDATRSDPQADAKADSKAAKLDEADGKVPSAAPADVPQPTPSDPSPDDLVPPSIDVDKVLAEPGVGVARCDEFSTTYLKCIDEHAPTEAKAEARRALAEQIAAWQQTKAGAKGADVALEIGCRTAAEGAKQATEHWGCRW